MSSDPIRTTDYIRIIAQKCNGVNDPVLGLNHDFKETKFKHKIILVGDKSGYYTAILNEKNEVIPVSDHWLMLEIYEFANSYNDPDFCLDMDNCKKVMKRLEGYADKYEAHQIKPIAQASENVICFKKLPFDLNLAGNTPNFDEMMSRWGPMAVNLMKFIGSFFDPEADRQRYAWVYGEGQDGKGSLIQILKEVFGQTFLVTHVPSNGDKHWTSSFLGKRVVVFPDENHYQFPTTGLFKSLTGGDPVRVEFKYKGVINADIDCMFMFFSNEKPNIELKKSDARRLLYIECQSYEGELKKDYIDLLKNEAPAWLSKCYQLYKKNSELIGAEEHARNLAVENMDQYIDLFESHFVRGPGCMIPASRVAEICREYGKMRHDKEIGRFYQAVEHVYKCTKEQIGRNRARYLVGCREMSQKEKSSKFGAYVNH